ncbi:polysialoglycoprotein-like [Coregonus clupeaformis]|uniref:polysialoglycoprotein-like n=1 Tax=Coregonus clupeaformis TaxID=59861 RepID=UPI001E1C58AE|nr:polysialoglycoprotein-like [Coregonus clupeaformis]
MGALRGLLLFVLTVGVFNVCCSPVGKSKKQDRVSLQRRFGELASNDVSIAHALALLRSIVSDSKQAREEYLETDDDSTGAATGSPDDDDSTGAATGSPDDDDSTGAATGSPDDDDSTGAATGSPARRLYWCRYRLA